MEALNQIDDVYVELRTWLNESDWIGDFAEFTEEFWKFFPEVSDGLTIQQVLKDLPPEDEDFASLITFENFLAAEFEGGETPYQAFLDGSEVSVDPDCDAFVRSLPGSLVSVYLVHEVDETSVLVSDVFREGDPIRVEEPNQTEWLLAGDRIAARVLNVNGTLRFSRVIVPLSPEMWKLVEEGAKDVRRESKAKGLPDDEFLKSLPDFTAALLFVERYYSETAGEEEPLRTAIPIFMLRYPLNTTEKNFANRLNAASDFKRTPDELGWIYALVDKGNADFPTQVMIKDGEVIALAFHKQAGKDLTKRLTKILGDGIGRPVSVEIDLNDLELGEDLDNEGEGGS